MVLLAERTSMLNWRASKLAHSSLDLPLTPPLPCPLTSPLCSVGNAGWHNVGHYNAGSRNLGSRNSGSGNVGDMNAGGWACKGGWGCLGGWLGEWLGGWAGDAMWLFCSAGTLWTVPCCACPANQPAPALPLLAASGCVGSYNTADGAFGFEGSGSLVAPALRR